jgi:hypothetical protein
VTAATLILACVAAAALVLLAGLQIADRVRRPRALERRLRKTVLVHRVGLPSIRGVLVEDAPDGLVLRRAQYLLEPEHRGEPAPEPVALDGDTIVPWELIDCVQDLQLTAAHVLAAVVVETSNGKRWRGEAPDDDTQIDGFDALAMALHMATTMPEPQEIDISDWRIQQT